jgi:hypothetical protein
VTFDDDQLADDSMVRISDGNDFEIALSVATLVDGLEDVWKEDWSTLTVAKKRALLRLGIVAVFEKQQTERMREAADAEVKRKTEQAEAAEALRKAAEAEVKRKTEQAEAAKAEAIEERALREAAEANTKEERALREAADAKRETAEAAAEYERLGAFLRDASSYATMHGHLVAQSKSQTKTATRELAGWPDPQNEITTAAAACNVTLKSDAELLAPFDAMWVELAPRVAELAKTAAPNEILHVHPVGATFLRGVHASHGIADLELYVEYANRESDDVPLEEGLPRRPDACFFKRGQRGDVGFDAGSQMAALQTSEWKDVVRVDDGKLDMNANAFDAIDGAIRDAEHVLSTALPLNDARHSYFTSVVGDGVRCALVRLSKSATGRYTVRVSAVHDLEQRDAAFAFFKLCVHALQLSASGSWTYDCGWTATGWPVNVRVSEVLAGGDTVVFRFTDATGGRKIAKAASAEKAGVERLAREIEQRQLVARLAAARQPPIDVARIFVPATEQMLAGHRALVFDDVGLVSFESLVYTLPLADVRRLAALVWEQTRASLALLHSLGLAFGDVHVGNILISGDLQRAVLIDCESICEFDTNLDRVLARQMFRPLGNEASADSDLESLRYCIAWARDIGRFRTGQLSRHSQCSAVADQWQKLKAKITHEVVEHELKC